MDGVYHCDFKVCPYRASWYCMTTCKCRFKVESKERLEVRRPVRTVNRSDGKAKIYGWTEDGKLCTVVMKPGGKAGYDIWHLKIGGKYRIYEGEVLK